MFAVHAAEADLSLSAFARYAMLIMCGMLPVARRARRPRKSPAERGKPGNGLEIVPPETATKIIPTLTPPRPLTGEHPQQYEVRLDKWASGHVDPIRARLVATKRLDKYRVAWPEIWNRLHKPKNLVT